MRGRWVMSSTIPAVSMVIAIFATLEMRAQTSGAQRFTPPKTEWGDPRLPGRGTTPCSPRSSGPRISATRRSSREEEAAAFEASNYLQRQEANTTVTAGFDWWDPGTARPPTGARL